MSDLKHIPGPLKVQSDPCHYHTKSDVVSNCGQLFASVGGRASWEVQEANTRRLAAAWNACEGIQTEALEAGVVAEMLAALKAILQSEPCAGSCSLTNWNCKCLCSLAWGVIAKAEGKS